MKLVFEKSVPERRALRTSPSDVPTSIHIDKSLLREKPAALPELSELDVMNVLAITRRELNVDNRRIYLMGHSIGGGGTWHLGIKYPSIWAGLAMATRPRVSSAAIMGATTSKSGWPLSWLTL